MGRPAIPEAVKRALRAEVGFCCPILACGNPYLTWHHFDPPWRIEHHNRAEGMIALCQEHASKADNGSFTDDQLRALKTVGRHRAVQVRGRFDWMRQDILAVVGNIFYYQTPVLLQLGTEKLIWFERDPDGYMLLNIHLPTVTGKPRARIDNNWWSVKPDDAVEVKCPPSGRTLSVKYSNGDGFHIEFRNITSSAELVGRRRRWAHMQSSELPIQYPVTLVEFAERAVGTPLQLTSTHTAVGTNRIGSGLLVGAEVGITIDHPDASRLLGKGNLSPGAQAFIRSRQSGGGARERPAD